MPVSGAKGFQSRRGLQGMDHNYAKPKIVVREYKWIQILNLRWTRAQKQTPEE
jgi:hypothetical protein